ncbi:MAG: hypothetical protein RBU30_21390, partial [Polyangia bacterium]|nr:hypothetical protein [Polyangia bacterium]
MTSHSPTIRSLALAALASGILLGTSEPARSQAGISPLSTAKLLVPSADPVPEGRLELGLHYQMGWSHRLFSSAGRLEKVRSLDAEAIMGVRLTYGIVDQREFGMELGTAIPILFGWGEDYETGVTYSAVGLAEVPIGAKLRVVRERDWSLSLAILGQVPTGDRNQVTSGYGKVGGGILISGR